MIAVVLSLGVVGCKFGGAKAGDQQVTIQKGSLQESKSGWPSTDEVLSSTKEMLMGGQSCSGVTLSNFALDNVIYGADVHHRVAMVEYTITITPQYINGSCQFPESVANAISKNEMFGGNTVASQGMSFTSTIPLVDSLKGWVFDQYSSSSSS